jgi:hypothetical protein
VTRRKGREIVAQALDNTGSRGSLWGLLEVSTDGIDNGSFQVSHSSSVVPDVAVHGGDNAGCHVRLFARPVPRRFTGRQLFHIFTFTGAVLLGLRYPVSPAMHNSPRPEIRMPNTLDFICALVFRTVFPLFPEPDETDGINGTVSVTGRVPQSLVSRAPGASRRSRNHCLPAA